LEFLITPLHISRFLSLLSASGVSLVETSKRSFVQSPSISTKAEE